MTAAVDPALAESAGLLAGALGVSAALWLQMVSRRDVDSRHVCGFYALGTGLVLINLDPVWPDSIPGAEAARLLVFVALLFGQAYIAFRVWAEAGR